MWLSELKHVPPFPVIILGLSRASDQYCVCLLFTLPLINLKILMLDLFVSLYWSKQAELS